jgi:integrase
LSGLLSTRSSRLTGPGCPQLLPLRCDGPAARVSHPHTDHSASWRTVSHPHSNHSASRRTHDVRHTYSTLSLDTGIEPKILSDRVGHSNPAVTFQIYAHRSTGQDRAAAELIGQLIERAVAGPKDPAPEAC